jgi:hypothetical protein
VWRSRLERGFWACVRACVHGVQPAWFWVSVILPQRCFWPALFWPQRYFGLSVVSNLSIISNLSVVFVLSGFGLNMFGYTALRQYKLAVEQQLYLNSIK